MLRSDIKSVVYIIFEIILALSQRNDFFFLPNYQTPVCISHSFTGITVETSSLRVSLRLMVLKTFLIPICAHSSLWKPEIMQ